MPGGSGDYDDEGDKRGMRDAIPSASWPRRPGTVLQRFNLGTSDVDAYEDEDSDDANADEEQEALQADGGLTQNVKY